MATHKKNRLRRNPLGIFLVLAVLALSIFGSSTAASADERLKGEETSTVADTPTPKDDSLSEAPSAPEPEVVQKQEPMKVETPDSAPAEEEPKSDSPAPVKEESKDSSDKDKPDKITICHRTASYSNPYTSNSVAQSSVDGDGGNDHGQGDHFLEDTGPVFYPEIPKHTEWGDIIPPIPGVHDGLNWTDAGQAIYNNGCNVPPSPPKKIDIPVQPTFEDLCGPDNAEWNEQVDTDTLKWNENDEGHLIVTIIKDGVVFTDGTTVHDFGLAPESGEECGGEPGLPDVTVTPVCGAVNVINDEDEPLQGWLFDPLNESDEGQPFEVEANKSKLIKTSLTDVSWFVYFADSLRDHKGSVKVEQECDTPPPVDTPKPPSDIGTPVSLDRQLPDTGGSNFGLLVLGGGFVIAGSGIIAATRRRSLNV